MFSAATLKFEEKSKPQNGLRTSEKANDTMWEMIKWKLNRFRPTENEIHLFIIIIIIFWQIARHTFYDQSVWVAFVTVHGDQKKKKNANKTKQFLAWWPMCRLRKKEANKTKKRVTLLVRLFKLMFILLCFTPTYYQPVESFCIVGRSLLGRSNICIEFLRAT